MRQLFKSYDEYRKVVDELAERLQIEQKMINWKNYEKELGSEACGYISRELISIDLRFGHLKRKSLDILNDIDLFCDLKNLSISTSELLELPKSFFYLKQLEDLEILPYIERNPKYIEVSGILKSIPNDIGGLSNLKRLKICNQKLEILPNDLKYLQNLKTLILDKNNLKEIPDWIGDLSALEMIIISDNPITNLPKSIAKLPKLKSLYATNCQLTSIPKEIEELKSVTIRLGGNPLPLAKKLNYGLKELNEWK